MSIKISFMYYVKWARLMSPVVFKEFKLVCTFLLFFFYSLSFSISKRSTLAKFWGGLQPPPSQFLRAWNSKCLCFNEIISLIIMKMKTKKRSHRYDINRLKPRHGQKYTKYKMCMDMMMLLCITQHLSNIWSLIHEKVNNTEAELEKSAAYKI